MELMGIEDYLKTKNYKVIVNSLVKKFNAYLFREDIEQVCAIAFIESYNKYDESKCDNLFAYSYLRMYEYAKQEFMKQRNCVTIPVNKQFNGVEHNYENFEFDNSNSKFSEYSDPAINMDIKLLLSTLDEETKFIVETYNELTENGCDSTFKSISKILNMKEYTVRRRYLKAVKKMKEEYYHN